MAILIVEARCIVPLRVPTLAYGNEGAVRDRWNEIESEEEKRDGHLSAYLKIILTIFKYYE